MRVSVRPPFDIGIRNGAAQFALKALQASKAGGDFVLAQRRNRIQEPVMVKYLNLFLGQHFHSFLPIGQLMLAGSISGRDPMGILAAAPRGTSVARNPTYRPRRPRIPRFRARSCQGLLAN